MPQTIFIGVDGGATKTIVRVEDEAGMLLAKATGGPANIRLSVSDAWNSIRTALQEALQPLSIALADKRYAFHVGMGLAGCEALDAYNTFLQTPHPFTTLIVSSDAHTACLGAHDGEDGAIIIAGTGTVGYQIQQSHITKIGGYGFPHDDAGGGAWMGLEAVKVTLQSMDKRLPSSSLANQISAKFNHDLSQIMKWAVDANSTAYATLAPLVIEAATANDVHGIEIMKAAAREIDRIGAALYAEQVGEKPLPCALIGGVAPYLVPYLNNALSSHLRMPASQPDVGAVLLVRDHLKGIQHDRA